ncbi:DNA-binding Lrp family transcriptional regulator [Geothermobacter ehrlichii]|uniref:DNA-binding Lrp family transcriptional regulator n=1 Tax=Geothermobacter ehrlichii TaxID=213224 RepID=A0A5D3WHR3_9BACT|nr:Lrp/AsnC family transcriptional regulator [Geothermobacter ehrlichii]TYO95253.1 DNA-binding Lrp family transcriptional regulator [Geothermobacter ehrlichii]
MPKKNQNPDLADLAILRELQENARIPNSELAPKVGLSTSACLARTNRLRQQGVIKQFATIVDHEKIGLDIIAFTFVTLSPHSEPVAAAFAEQIEKLPQVTESYHVTGDHDYMLKIVARNIPAYREFVVNSLLSIEGVSKVETMMVLKVEKQRFSLPLEETRDNQR